MAAEPSPRWDPISAPVEGKVYLYGGRTRDFSKEKNKLASTVHAFDEYLEQWEEVRAEGPPPPGLCRGTCASAGHHLYVYGGEDSGQCKGCLHQLDTRTSTWTRLSGPALGGPMCKSGCGMVSHGEEELVLFGGIGGPSSHNQPGAEFVKGKYANFYSNEVHKFDLKEGTWSSPTVRGTRPSPCSFFSFTKTDDHHAVLFGGWDQKKRRTTNDVYIVDLTTMDWRKLDPHEGDPCPVARQSHAAVCLGYGGDHPQLLVTGGLDKDCTVLSDIWVLDLQFLRWKEVKLPWVQQARCRHSATALTHRPGLTEVILFGGCPEWPKNRKSEDDIPQIANTTVLRFEHQPRPSSGGDLTGEWVLTDIAEGSQLGTSQRVRRKIVKMSQATITSTSTATRGGRGEERVQAAERRAEEAVREKEAAQRRATEAERREQAAERRAAEAVREKEAAQRRATEAERREQAAERRATEAEMEKEVAMARQQETEARQQEAGARIQEAEIRRQEAEARQQQAEWVVERREIEVTGPELGRGGWASVSVAKFRGVRVAAKVIHGQIVSPHNVQLFRREMDMASRIRHPNLLQFIGATQRGEMIILTELMPTSLRRELEEGYMAPRLVISIGLDVVRALNYLHLMRPRPMIHRDISSANILLEPLPNSRWRAKVSDYGTVNLQQQLSTVGPGSPCYAAPEANNPTQQSPKMDIYSFGALILEMLTGELPARDERARLIGAVRHLSLLALIRRCLSLKKEDRPSASDIISELDP